MERKIKKTDFAKQDFEKKEKKDLISRKKIHTVKFPKRKMKEEKSDFSRNKIHTVKFSKKMRKKI